MSRPISVIWDLEGEGNVEHIAEHGVSVEEWEDVLFGPGAIPAGPGRAEKVGETRGGRRLKIAWDWIDDAMIYPITGFDV